MFDGFLHPIQGYGSDMGRWSKWKILELDQFLAWDTCDSAAPDVTVQHPCMVAGLFNLEVGWDQHGVGEF